MDDFEAFHEHVLNFIEEDNDIFSTGIDKKTASDI